MKNINTISMHGEKFYQFHTETTTAVATWGLDPEIQTKQKQNSFKSFISFVSLITCIFWFKILKTDYILQNINV